VIEQQIVYFFTLFFRQLINNSLHPIIRFPFVQHGPELCKRLLALQILFGNTDEYTFYVSQEQLTVTDALDTMVKWFCILFNNQFTPDEVYDNYPADRLMHDIALALMAVQTQTTEVLDTFPTIPVVQEAEQILAAAENPEVTIPQET